MYCGIVKHSPRITSSNENAVRLKGSFASERRWDLIVDRSMTVREIGRITGSRMTVNISGSARRGTTTARSACKSTKEDSGKRTKEFVRHLAQVVFCLKCGFGLLGLTDKQHQLLNLGRRFEVVF